MIVLLEPCAFRLLFALTGEPFCEDPACRLFNAHWQAEMLRAQLEGPDYCERHQELLRRGGATSGA